MSTPTPLLQADFLQYLEHHDDCASCDNMLPGPLASMLSARHGDGKRNKATGHLIELLKARQATLQAALDAQQVADTLRRDQKFARPGQPSAHIVQLRQQQAAARQAGSQSKQALIKAAAAFVREAGIEVPQRVALELFITRWIDANVPSDASVQP